MSTNKMMQIDMKKQYIIPRCVVVEVDAEELIAQSPGFGNGYSDPNLQSLVKGRRNQWFDDWDEE